MLEDSKLEGSLTKASEKYIEWSNIRAAVQLIPGVGGAIDTWFGGRGSKLQNERTVAGINELSRQLSIVENRIKTDLVETEEFFDLFMTTFDGIIRSRSEDKRARFCSIITNKITSDKPWDEAELAIRILTSLDDNHVKIINLCYGYDLFETKAGGIRYRSTDFSKLPIDDNYKNDVIDYKDQVGNNIALLLTELVSRGLLEDTGYRGELLAFVQEYKASNTAQWFLDWIKSPE